MVKNINLLGVSSSRTLLHPSSTNVNGFTQSKRTLVRIQDLILPHDYPDPWPYKERSYFYWIHGWIDRTKPRFHENTKLFTVEGNIGAGKDKLARRIADEFGLLYMREFRMDDILIDRYGNDMRNFYHMFPKRFRIPDFNMFFQNPYDEQSAVMQDRIYECRWEQWLNALAHMFNTGQGVIVKRPAYSDFIFANAMRSKNYISAEFFKRYYFVRKLTIEHLQLWPHVIIYLDCPISKCLENIQKRGNKDEINIVDEKYLKVIEESYKDFLKECKRHSKVFVYDWSDPTPEHEDRVIEDLLGMDEFVEWHSSEVWDAWKSIGDELHYTLLRHKLTDKYDIGVDAWDHDMGEHECEELTIYPFDFFHWDNVMINEVLKSRFNHGYTSKDPYQGMGIRSPSLTVPEKWVEYYYREQYYDNFLSTKPFFDPAGEDYDPNYLKGHH